ncbi:MAG: hypothetical protein ACXVZP_00340 [Gaiellaceae bacterium]
MVVLTVAPLDLSRGRGVALSEPLAEKLVRKRPKLRIGSRWYVRRADVLAHIERNLRIPSTAE